MTDVAVIGAGPTGIHTAYLLAQAGLDVVLFEAQSRIGDRAICSGVVGDEAFARFDLPTDPILSEIKCIQAVSPGGKKLEYRTEGPLAQVIDKGEFNRSLAQRAVNAGAKLQLGCWVNSLAVEKHSVEIQYRPAEEAPASLRAQVAIITTGVNGSLNHSLGLAHPRQFLRAVQAEMSLPPNGHGNATRVFVGRGVAPGAFGWEIPLGNNRWRVGLMTEDNPDPYFVKLVQRVSPNTDISTLKIDRKGIAQAAVGRCVVDRVIAAGEAAGHIKTTTGGGIYYGLLSAELVADVVSRAFRTRNFSTRTLGEFERYWRSTFGNELIVGYFARKLAGHFSDNQIDRFFDAANASDLLVRLNGRLKFDWHHRALLATLRSLLTLPGGIGRG
ncbi:MAG: NAD(P)/FAD-dependent oxidoreductase [Acidobacteriota bacterium]|nr:NAD(P)/FAD-dependent oxidoreductase [Acidobacteriota bacterium]